MKRIFGLDVQLWMGVAIVAALAGNVFLAWSVTSPAGAQSGDGFADLEVTFLTTPDCEQCFDLQTLREYLVQNGVSEDRMKSVAFDSREGKKLIKKHDVKRVPTAVIPSAATGLDFMAGLAENIGSINNGALVITQVELPYLDLEQNKVVGEFELVVLDDQSCIECYDPALHDDVLKRIFMTPAKRSVVDISSQEGKDMLESYAITAVPTILLRGDLQPYETLQEIWSSVGTIEDDQTYVLRQGVTTMGPYKQLPEGAIIDETAESGEAAA